MSDIDEPFDGDLPPLDPDVAAWLASDPAPPMPEDVWARLESRLAAEAPLVPAGVVDLDAERQRRRRVRVLPVLAGAAGIALVGAVVLPSILSPDPAPVADGADVARAVSASADVVSPAPAESPGGAVALPAPEPSAPTVTSGDPATIPSGQAAPMPRAVLTSGTDYTAETLPEQVTSLLATAGMVDGTAVANAVAATPTATALPGGGLASSPEALADCLGRLGLPIAAMPLVLDSATIDGRAGSVIVTVDTWDDTGQPTALHAVAVGQDCTDEDVAAARHWDLVLAP